MSSGKPESHLENLLSQPAREGVGPLYHRVYALEFFAMGKSCVQWMDILKADINRFSPQTIATFEKVSGAPDHLKVGDRFQIHITGPWNGPVEVCEIADHSFTLATLEGHVEAGQIRFSLRPAGAKLRFEIESWARSSDRLVDLLYDKIPLMRSAQTTMWVKYGRAFAQFAGAESNTPEDVEVRTEVWDGETRKWVKA